MDLLRRTNGPSDLDGRLTSEPLAKQREFLALLAEALPKLSRFCRAMCRDGAGRRSGRLPREELAKDLISETVLKAYEHFDRVRERQAFLSYLFTIAVRIHRHERVRSKRWQPFEREHFESLIDDRNAPDANADVSALYAALDKLPTKQREAIVMSEIVGLKLEEVAEIQGASLSAVKSRVSRGRKKLAKLLGVGEESKAGSVVMTIPPNGVSSHYHTRFAFQARSMSDHVLPKERLL